MKKPTFILGAGMTGLGAGFASGLPILEAADSPGGICSSYYLRAGKQERHMQSPSDGEAYRFEIGGGHWIFGGDPAVLHFMGRFVKLNRYARQSSVYFHTKGKYVPYPIQNHLGFLGGETAERALAEMAERLGSCRTMKQWLVKNFGHTLCSLFFYPFNGSYTAGLYDRIAPQDAYKSPVNLALAIQGAAANTPPTGYNATFVYPQEALNILAQRLANRCDVQYGKRVAKLDVHGHTLYFDDGTTLLYENLISTLPLNKVMEISGVSVGMEPDPYTSVLVLNIGAFRGDQCPSDHWLYTPDTTSAFHRVGFYSNVDPSFLPLSARGTNDRVSIYVERAYGGGEKPSDREITRYAKKVVDELQDWGFVRDAEVVDPTWIDVAYTWSWPGSDWKKIALETLQKHGIYQVGRYGRWVFQGIADSIRDGLLVGSAFKGNPEMAKSHPFG
ncbi:MAG: protoporphyrinogen oxidase-like protein [Thermodesulfobacteriota bacterium]|nr:protoporphyrinogen oxidase-like protein [Thermodesulfobacteriota bacterium]